MYRHCIIYSILYLCLYPAAAQGKLPEEGKPYPNKALLSVAHPHGIEQVSLAGWKGKPLIVDFFSSGCVVCFKSMPKLNQLQEQYKDKVRFLLVGKEDKDIRRVYERFREGLGLKLDVAYDSVLHRDLKSYSYPLYVWIDAAGIVRAITGVDQLTPANVEKFANAFIPDIKTPPAVIPFNAAKPFLVNGNGGCDSLFLSRSLFSRWTPATSLYLPSRIGYGSIRDSLQLLGASLSDLYLYAYFSEAGWFSSSSLYGNVFPFPILENGTILQPGGITDIYCYSLWLSREQSAHTSLQQRFQLDLETQFGYLAAVEYRMMPYNRIRIRDGFEDSLKAKNNKGAFRFTYAGLDLEGCYLQKLVDKLAARFQKQFPFIDETGLSTPVSLSIEALMTDFDAVKKALYQKGIEITSSVKPMRVIVLRAKGTNVAAL